MNHVFNFKDKGIPNQIKTYKLPVKTNLFVSALVLFVAVAAMQAFQLGTMRSEAKSLNGDIQGIRAERTVLLEQYSSYDNNLSYYFDH